MINVCLPEKSNRKKRKMWFWTNLSKHKNGAVKQKSEFKKTTWFPSVIRTKWPYISCEFVVHTKIQTMCVKKGFNLLSCIQTWPYLFSIIQFYFQAFLNKYLSQGLIDLNVLVILSMKHTKRKDRNGKMHHLALNKHYISDTVHIYADQAITKLKFHPPFHYHKSKHTSKSISSFFPNVPKKASRSSIFVHCLSTKICADLISTWCYLPPWSLPSCLLLKRKSLWGLIVVVLHWILMDSLVCMCEVS